MGELRGYRRQKNVSNEAERKTAAALVLFAAGERLRESYKSDHNRKVAICSEGRSSIPEKTKMVPIRSGEAAINLAVTE
jgi:hypothetical protein